MEARWVLQIDSSTLPFDEILDFCKESMTRNRFQEISRFLRFDKKSTHFKQLEVNKFAMISEVRDSFIENCICSYKPGDNN